MFDQIDCLERPEDCMYDLNLNSSDTAQYIFENFVVGVSQDEYLTMSDESSFVKTVLD